jgi:RNA polymerase sigma factor (sigma-70 family)
VRPCAATVAAAVCELPAALFADAVHRHDPRSTGVSHPERRRCSQDVKEEVKLVGHGETAPAAVVPPVLLGDGDGDGRAAGRTARKDGVGVATPPGVRSDLEHVFRIAYPRVVAVAARVLGSRDEAEDVAQEVFLTFGRSSVPAGQAPGWLSVAAAHTALNHIRTGRRRASREAAGDDAAVCPDVADAVVTLDERRRVRAALARLPRKQAVALVLRHSGLSYAEVAATLGLSPGSVGTTVRRAESALRKELNRHASSD